MSTHIKNACQSTTALLSLVDGWFICSDVATYDEIDRHALECGGQSAAYFGVLHVDPQRALPDAEALDAGCISELGLGRRFYGVHIGL
jgi:hypothetical protein